MNERGGKQVEKLTYTLKEAAEAAQLSEPVMRELIYSEGFPAFRVGRRWVIPKETFSNWLNANALNRTVFNYNG